ncbi:MAG: hypothetical protein KOO66_12170 [Bacteroidales bacterium]|nr:hypothetical protein [Bacteroidales bacterium]
MKAASVKEIKDELKTRSPIELLELCLRLARFKKENKELLTYLLFEAEDEQAYIESIKRDIDEQFEQINRKSYFYIRKSIRKILKNSKKHIRYSQKKETEVDLLIYFCSKLKNFKPSIFRSTALQNLYNRQIELIKKAILTLHEDLQFDYESEMEELLS